jgi:hypothetical protein
MIIRSSRGLPLQSKAIFFPRSPIAAGIKRLAIAALTGTPSVLSAAGSRVDRLSIFARPTCVMTLRKFRYAGLSQLTIGGTGPLDLHNPLFELRLR